AGIVSTTYVQLLKGSLLVVFSTIFTLAILNRGFHVDSTDDPNVHPRVLATLAGHETPVITEGWQGGVYQRTKNSVTGEVTVWRPTRNGDETQFYECQTITLTADGKKLVNGKPQGTEPGEGDLFPVGSVVKLPDDATETGPLGP